MRIAILGIIINTVQNYVDFRRFFYYFILMSELRQTYIFQTHCESMESHLVIVMTTNENNYLKSYLRQLRHCQTIYILFFNLYNCIIRFKSFDEYECTVAQRLHAQLFLMHFSFFISFPRDTNSRERLSISWVQRTKSWERDRKKRAVQFK